MAVLLLFCFFFTTTEFDFVFLVFLFTKWKVVTFVVVGCTKRFVLLAGSFFVLFKRGLSKEKFVFLILFLYV